MEEGFQTGFHTWIRFHVEFVAGFLWSSCRIHVEPRSRPRSSSRYALPHRRQPSGEEMRPSRIAALLGPLPPPLLRSRCGRADPPRSRCTDLSRPPSGKSVREEMRLPLGGDVSQTQSQRRERRPTKHRIDGFREVRRLAGGAHMSGQTKNPKDSRQVDPTCHSPNLYASWSLRVFFRARTPHHT